MDKGIIRQPYGPVGLPKPPTPILVAASPGLLHGAVELSRFGGSWPPSAGAVCGCASSSPPRVAKVSGVLRRARTAQIGRVIDALEATGPSIADNTITCLWSDHGWHLGDTNSYTKLTNFETVRRTRRLVPALRLRKSFDCIPEQSPDDSVLPQSLVLFSRLEADNHTFDGHRARAIR